MRQAERRRRLKAFRRAEKNRAEHVARKRFSGEIRLPWPPTYTAMRLLDPYPINSGEGDPPAYPPVVRWEADGRDWEGWGPSPLRAYYPLWKSAEIVIGGIRIPVSDVGVSRDDAPRPPG